ncbi:MAG: Lon protease 1 [Eubacteriales bacterium SKADARSKE-1]|nr:Lon protease 1 [Eubacteriales bacterium SKADARSKE-1]
MSELFEKDFSKIKLPVLLLRGLVLFPGMILSFDVGRVKSIAALNEAMNNNQRIFVVTQKDVKEEDPKLEGLNPVGVFAEVKQVLRQKGNVIRVLVEGHGRGKISALVREKPFMEAEVLVCEDEQTKDSLEEVASLRTIRTIFKEYVKLSPMISPDLIIGVSSCEDPGKVADYLAANLNFDYKVKQDLLNKTDVLERLEDLMGLLLNELNILSIEQDLNLKLIDKIELGKKEYFLREQKQIISEELGEKDFQTESEELKGKIIKLKLPKSVHDQLTKECIKLSNMQPGSQETNVIRNYIELCLDLPWNKKTKEKIDLGRAQAILDRDHYGLSKVKERIIETLAVRKLTNDANGQIICLVGPPGVGKTSIAKSIAKAIGRRYARISLGGVHDEADIRGHRKTYVGAMPGRIITAIKSAGSKNPLILLDEIDKLGKDQFGDPVSALLEVLDSEQNYSFYDHYVDMPFDLSEVFFITTANNYESIPEPLLDRMDVIELISYTSEEKYHIGKEHLIPKQLKKHGITKGEFKISEAALRELITCYTREAGVRTLERTIANLMRKAAKTFVSGEKQRISINTKDLEEMLGPRKFLPDKLKTKVQVGVSTGLAWTKVGGETISVEVATMPGTGKVKLTGSLGDVMKESAQTAISFIRSNAKQFSIDPNFYNKLDIHIHVPQGATPKDGPSAGVTLASAIVSALTGIPVKQNAAMTGEITLRGRVLAVGGLREKTMAAYRAGVDTVIIPKENESDLSELDSIVKSKMKFIVADNMDIVLKNSLVSNKFNSLNKSMLTKRKKGLDSGVCLTT